MRDALPIVMKTKETVARAIEESVLTDSVVYLQYTEELHMELLVLCDANEGYEYWGDREDASGSEWRIRLTETELVDVEQ